MVFRGIDKMTENIDESSDEEKRLDAMEEAEASNPYRELTFEEVDDILSETIKFDSGNKLITFLVMLGTYTDEEQSNVMYRAEASTGKSYIPLEIMEFFPEEDVQKISYASPTSFFHKYGKRVREEKTTTVEDGTPKKETHTYYEIDMSKKIYIFKDMPSVVLLERLRSLLSHDEKEMQIQFTNKTEHSGYRTQHIVIKGYPTVIFCTATTKIFDMQESTRFFVLSPEIETDKIKDSIRLSAERKGNKKLFLAKLNADAKRHFLKQRVRNIKAEEIFDVVIPDSDKVAEDFINSKKYLHPRHMRDFGRLLSLIKYWALLNCWSRDSEMTNKGKIIYANNIDVEIAFILYKTICEANELGVSPEVYNIYSHIFEKLDDGTGLTKEQISIGFLQTFHRPLGSRRLNKEILPNLMASGLIYDVEGTGIGGKPKLYRCSKYMDAKENGECIDMQRMLIQKIPQSLQQKLNMVLEILQPNMSLKTIEIETQTNGSIPKEELPKLLQTLYDNGKVFKPNDDTWQRSC